MTQPIWQLTVDRAAQAFAANLSQGLTAADVARRLQEHGPNQLQQKAGEPPWKIFLAQFQNIMIWVLIGAAVVSGILREWVDTFAILGIVVLNAILGFIQEYRAEKALAALRKLASPSAKVIRDGQPASVPSADLVPGDLVELEAGDYVPADGRVVYRTAGFAVQEASLTGESTPVAKDTGALAAEETQLADRSNMVFMGTAVVSGRGRALLVATGMRTELGRIAGMIQDVAKEETPLQKKLDRFGRLIVQICFVLVALVFALEWLRGGKLVDVFLTAVSLAVAAIPEGLPAVVTIALALGVHRMVRRHVLIRKLPSVETLGCATVICTDKTGTLTRNEMTVRAAYAGGRLFRVAGAGYEPVGQFTLDGQAVQPDRFPELRQSLQAGALCNNARLINDQEQWRITGDPTEGALLTGAAKAGLWKETLEKDAAYVEEIPFDSERKMMSVVRRDPAGRLIAYVKGAPDVLLQNCSRLAEGGAVRPLTAADRARLANVNAELAQEALRVLAIACRPLERAPEQYAAADIERDLTLLGLVAMMDPPREEARTAMRTCRSAGIRAVMITGDHKNTALAVGRELELCGPAAAALTGEDLEKMPDAELERRIDQIAVYARVAPEHKLRIVRAWRKRGEIVAMTGDGVNDAPAVKEADIGVAMGITGTDVTKEVSDMVVTDDNFASIVAAVEEGRGIYDNILKFVHYLLSCNAGEILVMFLASLIGWPVPLLPIHILWVNLVTDGLPALALGVDPVDRDIMRRPPRRPDEAVVNQSRGLVMVLQGFFIALCTLAAFLFVRTVGQGTLEQARSAAFIVLACAQLFHAFNCRSATRSIFSLGLFSNMKLVYAAGISFLLQLAVVEIPALRVIFKTVPLTALDWVAIVALSSFPLWAMEAVKLVRRLATRRDGL